MHWLKDFLKPNLIKIVIVLVLVSLNFSMSLLQDFPSIISLIRLILLNPVLIILRWLFFLGLLKIPYITIIFWLIYWYLLACLIYFIFSKLRKRLSYEKGSLKGL